MSVLDTIGKFLRIKAPKKRSRITKRSKKSGLPPGSLVYIGEQQTDEIKITLIDYDKKNFKQKEVKKIEECFPFKKKSTVTWINIDGLHDVEVIKKLGTHFDIHPLVLEDILNTEQRPKMEDFEDYIYMIVKMLTFNDEKNEIESEQMSLILGKNFVISFQEKQGDMFDNIRERIKNNKGKIRNFGADFLAYSLLDTVVDNYFSILEKMGDKTEDLEDEAVLNPIPSTHQTIHFLKRQLIALRKSIWPLRELLNKTIRGDSKLFNKSTRFYMRDVYDHTIQIIDNVEVIRDIVSGLRDTYLSSISNRMNEIMKTLTIIATIFIPLTFIVGVYGMNFDYMPELNWHFGYFAVWIVMISISVLLLFYFRRKKWI